LRLLDPATGKPRLGIGIHDGPAFAVAFAPDGKTLATAAGRAACLWDVPGGCLRAELRHGRLVQSVAFSPDGTWLASGEGHRIGPGERRAVRLWDAKAEKPLRAFGLGLANARGLAFAPDGRSLAVDTSYDGVLRLWDARDGTAQLRLPEMGL